MGQRGWVGSVVGVARFLRSPLALVLLAGLALRVAAMVGYQPAYLVFSDTHAYVLDAADLGEAFATDAPFRPYGYAIFLAGVASVSQTVTAVVVVQHLLGLATAALLYATVLRLGGPRWAAVASAAVVAFVPDFVLFEHALLTEAPFLFWSPRLATRRRGACRNRPSSGGPGPGSHGSPPRGRWSRSRRRFVPWDRSSFPRSSSSRRSQCAVTWRVGWAGWA